MTVRTPAPDARSPRSSRMGALAPVYDLLTAPFERRTLGPWRAAAWAHVPAAGVGLEIGAGTGAGFRFHPGEARVVATDVSERMLRAAGRKAGAGPALTACDVQALPFADASVDWVVATLVFCEVPDPERGLREVRRVLRPGGLLAMVEHVRPSGWLGRLADALTAVTSPLLGEHFDRNAAESVLQAGLELEAQRWLWRDAVTLLLARRPGWSQAP